MLSTTASDPREILKNLIHDLRQPLGNIENSAYFLDLLLSSAGPQVKEQLRAIEHQVEQAARLLAEAAAEVFPPRRPVESEREVLVNAAAS